VRARNLNLFTVASADQAQYEDRNLNGGVKRTVQKITLGTTGDFRDDWLGGGVNTYDAALISGQVKYAEGASAGLDDDPKFTRLTFGFTRLQDLVTGRALVYMALRGQYAPYNLDTTEQFRLGGPGSVRAFPSGEGTGDIGAVTTLELRFLPPEDWFGRVARELVGSVFVDAGYVQYRYRPRVTAQPNAGPNSEVFTGAGIGLAWERPNEYAMRMSIAKPISGTSRTGETSKSVLVFLQAAVLFY
jgi:hemolysin activation/secretion protein